MTDKNKINSETAVYGLYKTTFGYDYKKVALNTFFLNAIDALELKEHLLESGSHAFYSTLKSTYGRIFEGGISYSGALPRLFENIDEYFAFKNKDEMQL